MRRLNIRAGDRFGRLMILSEVSQRKGRRCFLCICSCGKTTAVTLIRLTTRKTRSCGCLAAENPVTHGLKKHPLYGVWSAMKSRCFNQNSQKYAAYGGRGITVCPEWCDFMPFFSWAIAAGYSKSLTIERIDNDGDYEPGNCTWIPLAKQANNRRTSRLIQYKGEVLTLADCERKFGVNQKVISKRLGRGWTINKALGIDGV